LSAVGQQPGAISSSRREEGRADANKIYAVAVIYMSENNTSSKSKELQTELALLAMF
jgi:hypothetical protein